MSDEWIVPWQPQPASHQGPAPGRARHSRVLRDGARTLVLLFALGVFAVPCLAQLPELPGQAEQPALEGEAGASDPLLAASIQARLGQVEAELAGLPQLAASASGAEERAHASKLAARLRELKDLLEAQSSLLQSEPGAESAADADAAPSVFALNALLDLRLQRSQSEERLEEVIALRRAALDSAKEKLKAAEQARREARSEAEAAPDASPEKARVLALRSLAARLAQARVHLATLEVRAAAQARSAAADHAALDARIETMRAALEKGRGDASAGFAALAERIASLERARDQAEQRLATSELRLQVAQKRYAEQRDPGTAGLEEVEALTAQHASIRLQIDAISSRIDNLTLERGLWEHWQRVLGSDASREELDEWQQAAEERGDRFEQVLLQVPGRITDIRRRLQAVEERLAVAPKGSLAERALEGYRQELSTLLEARGDEAAGAESAKRANERVLAELRGKRGEFDPIEWARRGLESLRDAWSYEITAVDDSPITVGSVLLALILFGVGTWAARRGSAFVGRLATQRLKLDPGASHALQTLAFYALLVSFTLLALRAVHFPLTAFTVLGGALAIGIGFGSQNVMNNFISGLILMLERPVRARDVIEVDGNHGTVERIGARSTQIRSMDGRYIIVPNSFFLENNVVNWTLSDDLFRTKVSVGVIYGSPTRLVAELIQRVVDEEDQVIKDPAPIIIFNEFGDNSLNFDVHFWVTARSPMATRVVESRLRFRIDDLFREHDLVIAFPQRDVHLDTVSPLEVRMVQASEPAAKDT